MKKTVEVLKKYPISPFLLVFFVFVHAYNYAYKWMLFSDLLVSFIYSIISVSIFFYVLNKILKSTLKSGIITSLLTLVFFYIGFIKEYVITLTGAYVHLRFSLPVIFILLIFLFLKIRKFDTAKIVKINYFFNLLFLIYILVDVGISTFNILLKPQPKLELVDEKKIENVSNTQIKTQSKPDVYFLVFDEYSSSISLKENYGYDNSPLDSFLISKGFFISNYSKSNYTYTIFSLASTLNLNYFKNAKDLNFPDDFGLVWKYIYDNKVFKTFKEEGYEIENFSFFNVQDYPNKSESFSKAWAFKFVFDKSLFSVFNIGYLWIDKKHFTNKLENKLAEINIELNANSTKPKFLYIHFLLPHHPYVFNNKGAERSVFDYGERIQTSNEGYINQLIFTNKVIRYVINKIMLSDRNKIILLEGDHGNRFFHLPDSSAKARYFFNKNDFKNLNAYYFFDKNYSQLKDSISPVNSFRVIFNQYFNKTYSLLKDSSVF